MAESDLAGYRPLIEQFEAQHSHIRVRLVAEAEIVSNEETNRIAALATAADVFPYSPDVHEGQQYLLDLQPLLSADATFDSGDFLPGLLDNGNMWSLPVAASYPLLFFDKAAFDAADLAYPEVGWTLDEFLTTAQALTLREANEVVQWGYVPFQVQPLLATQLTAPLVVDGQPRFTDPDVVAALQWLADLFILHEVSPWLENYKPLALRETTSGPDPSSLARSGRAAMWSAAHVLWQFGYGDENVGLATIPRSQQDYAADATRYAFAISRGTAQPQAAWQLLTFLSRQPPVSGMIELLVPARRSVIATADFWDSVPEAMVGPLQYAASNNTTPRLTPAAVESLRMALTAVIENTEPVTEALAQAQAAAAGQATAVESATPFIVATPEGEPAAAGETVTEIIFLSTWNETEAHRRLARTFNQATPGVRVTVRRIEGHFYEEIASADCFASLTGVTRRGHALLQPVNALFDLDPELSPDDFYPGTTGALTQQGQLLGIPAWITVPLIEYNQELFIAAGIAEPPPDWTLAEFLETAQALTGPAAGQYGFVDWAQHRILDNGIVQFGVSPIVANNGVATIDYGAIAPVVRWYADLVRLHGVHPVLPGDLVPWRDYFDRHDLFVEMAANGHVAMWPYDPTDRTFVERLSSAGVETGLATFPRGPEGYSFSLVDRLTAYFITANTSHPQLCWQWLKFLATQPAAVAAGSLPAHIATAESAEFAAHVGAEQAVLLLAGITGGSGQVIWWGLLDSWMNPGTIWLVAAAARASRGEIDVDSALADADDKFTRYRECVIERQAFDDQAEWQACALEVDPDLSRRYE